MNVRSQTRGIPTIPGGSSEPMAATKTMTTPLGWTRRWCRRRKRASTETRAMPTIGHNLLLTLALSCFLIFSGTTASETGNVTGLDAGPTKIESWAGLGGIGAGAEDIEQILKTLAIAAARAGTGFGAGTGTGWGGAGWRGGRGAGGWGDPDESEGALGGGWGSSTLTLTVWENEPAGTLIGDVSAAFGAQAAGAATSGDGGKSSSPFSPDGVHAPSSSSSSSSSSSDPGKVPLDPLAHADGTVRFLVVPADGGDGGDDGGGDITVDVFTGELRTARVLDRETRDRYHFVVLPIAPLLFTASSLPLDSPVRVTVRVLDVNDNEPRFGSRHGARGDARHDLYDVGDPGGDDGTKEDEEVRLEISEGVPVGARFSLPPAWDPDEGTHGVQGYTLSDDDDNDGSETDSKPTDAGSVPTQDDRPPGQQRRRLPFLLEWDVSAERLELVVVSPLDREARPGGYRLRARAHDGGAPARVSRPGLTVRVALGDENDQAPAFSRRRYGASVSEDAALGTSVARVRASDGDQGVNARVRYELDRRLGDPGGFFSVDPRSGVVRLRRRLDFESQHRHELVVVARDGGAPPLSAAAFLSVRVVDVNEHPPLISTILFGRHGDDAGGGGAEEGDGDDGSSPRVLVGVVSEDAPLGLIVARVSVHDADLPDPTALPGPPSSPDLVAWPGPPRNDGYDNDHEGGKEEEEEDEESDEGSRGNGGDAQQASRDDPQDGGDDSQDGVWDPSGGNGGAGGGRPRLPTTLTLSGGEGVFELLPSASAITASSSSIPDAGTAPSPAPHSGTGAAGGTSGSGGVYLLRVSGSLDREARGRYRLTLRARDGAWPPLESTVVLDVLVDDVNDNDPVFVLSSSSSDAVADVPENAALGTWVARVSASDTDAGENGRVRYAVVAAQAAGGDDGTTADRDGRAWECAHTSTSLSSSTSSSLSDVGGWFSVDPATGVLSVAGALDHERAPRGVLVTVAASDGGAQPRVAKATLLISIADSNECRPEFRFPGDRELNLSVARSEVMVGKCLGKVVALDGDGGEFGEVRYSLEPAATSAAVPRVPSLDAAAASPWLSVGTRSGALCVSRSLGADVSTETFTVRATDKGGLFSETRVRVSLLGDAAGPSRPRGGSPSPEAPPRRGSPGSPGSQGAPGSPDPGPRVTFARPRLSFSVREDAPVGTPIGTVTSTGAHAGVMYWGAGPFLSVHPTSGLLVTAAPLDRESNPHISARVRASFLGPRPRSRPRPGSARPAGDEGDNEDNDNNEEEAVASVSVTVLDVNDNAPRFPSDHVDVRLESPTFDVRAARSGGGGGGGGSAVTAVVVLVAVAHDEDAGKHGSVWYSLRGADGRFLVEPRSGVITVAPSALAPGARFAFEVVAQDRGSPALSSSLHVTVSVEPTPPGSTPILPSLFFPTPEIRASVPEGATPGTHVVTLRAFTPFSPAPATASGTQTTTGTGIEIGTAGGIGSDVATGSVSGSKTGTGFESGSRSGAGLRLGVEARSSGGNGTTHEQWGVHYSLAPDDAATPSSSSSSSSWSCFRVDARTGRVTTRCRLDREQSPTLTLTLVARLVPLIPSSPTVWPLLSSSPHRHRRRHRAGAEPDIMATARILVSITDDNNHSPVPARDDYFFTVLENDSGGDSAAGGEPGSLVGMVSASDSDSGLGGWVSFAVEHVESPAACGPSPTGAHVSFHVHPTRGEVRAIGLLDREACPWHRVTLRVSDAGAPPRSALCRVHVAVADANDNAPRFLRSQYHAQVETEVPVGTLVATLMAEDPDEGPNGTVVYSLPAGGLGLLLVERDTGRVRTARALTRSDPRSATLAVRAGDLGNPPRHSGTVLHLTILAVGAIPRAIGDEDDDIDGSDDDNVEEDVPSSVIRLTVPPGSRPGAIIGRVPPPSPSTVATTVFRIISPRQRLHGDDEEEEEGEEVEDDSPFYVDATSGSVFLRHPVAPDDVGSASLPFALDVETVTMGDGRHGDPVVRRVLVLLTVSPSAGERRSPSSSPPSLPPRFRSTGPVGWVWEDAAPGTPVLIAGPPLSRGLRYSLAYQAPAAASLTDLGYRRQRRGLSGSGIQTFVRNETGERSKEEMGLGILRNLTTGDRVTAIRPIRQRRSSGPVWTPAGGSGSSGGGGAGTGPFTVDATTGVVRTAAPLDREVAERYLLVITVVPDGGVEAMGTPVAVANVYVGDVNDVAPVFVWPPPQEPPSHVIVWEGERPGRDLVTLRGRDPDGGMGGHLRFSIAGGNEGGTFFLHPETGVLSLARTPDRETHASYLLRLTISDCEDGLHGDDSSRGDSSQGDSQRRLETSTTLTVTVMDVNDQAPRFLPQQERALGDSRGSHRSVDDGDVGDGDGAMVTYECAVEENAPAGTTCVHVTAVDGDEGAGGEVVYTLLSGLVDFSVNERTGLVSTRRPLDRESQHEYTLTVRASDRGTPPCWSLASVVVRVLDRNDNAPLFAAPPHLVAQSHGQRHLDDVNDDDAAAEHDEEEEDYVGGDEAGWRARVSEDSPMGTPVITMVATDADAGENGMVRYHLADGSGSSHFHIDPVTGSLTTAAPLDREAQPRYRLVVEAVDCGPGPPPQFPAGGGASSSSRLPNDGCAGLRSTSIVFVSVLDVNDNSPVFVFGDAAPSPPGSPGPESVERQRTEGPEYRAIVPEGLVAGSPVLWVSAADADSGIRGRVRYRLVGGTSGIAGVTVPPFAIDPESGIVFVAVPRLRAPPERSGSDGGAPDGSVSSTDVPEPHYRLWVEAVDGGRPPHSSRVSALVALVPGSGRAPEFRHGPLVPTVPAGRAAVNALVATVVARDEDSGAGGALAYRLEAGDPHKFFRIDANTGELLVRRPLQGFVGADLAVAAWDHGSPPRAARTVVSVRVGPGPPSGGRAPLGPPLLSFVPTAYEATLPEHSPRDTLVCVVEAAWSDATTRLLTFSILYGNDDGAFSLNANTGRLTVRDPAALDFESMPRRVVIITARVVLPNATTVGIAGDAAAATEGKEGDKMAAVAIAAVTVTLRDVNDNAPRFPWQRLATTVRENEPAGTVVTQLVAWDVDGGAGGQLEFALAPGSLSSGFRLDSLTGIITTTASLDREAAPVHQLEVWAVDRGRPRLTGSTVVRVTVEDVNDNAPVIAASQHLVVSESVPVGTEIGHVLASDPDLYPRLEFSVVERTSGSSSVNDDTDDVNDATAVAASLFTVERLGGRVTLARPLDFEQRRELALRVRVSDGAHRSEATILITVADDNDNAPSFLRPLYEVSVDERTPPLISLITVAASDRDAGANGRLSYQLIPGSSDGDSSRGGFGIHAMNGSVFLTSPLRMGGGPHCSHYVVEARDAGSPPRSASAALLACARDVNAHAPVFSRAAYTASLPAVPGPGVPVLTVTATDADGSPGNGRVDFALEAGDPDGLFRLEPVACETYVADAATGAVAHRGTARLVLLDAPVLSGETEEKAVASPERSFELVVSATDRGDPPLSSTATVVVTVMGLEEGQQQPVSSLEFAVPEYRVSLPASAVAGAEVTQVLAKFQRDDSYGDDSYSRGGFNDKGAAVIGYQIVAGDRDNLFTVDPRTGAITLRAPRLNRPPGSEVTLVVEAAAAPGAVTTPSRALVPVHVRVSGSKDGADERDLAAFFSSVELLNASVSENEPAGTRILNFPRFGILSFLYSESHAGSPRGNGGKSTGSGLAGRDRDTHAVSTAPPRPLPRPSSSTFASSFCEGAGNFVVEPHTGTVRTSRPLDYEECPRYRLCLTVAPVPAGTAAGADGTTTGISRGALVGGSGGVGSLVSGAATPPRAVAAGGVMAPARSWPVCVHVLVQGADEFAPHFEGAPYRFAVPRGAAAGDTVGRVSASDRDAGPDSTVRYRLAQRSPYFTVNRYNGDIMLKVEPRTQLSSSSLSTSSSSAAISSALRSSSSSSLPSSAAQPAALKLKSSDAALPKVSLSQRPSTSAERVSSASSSSSSSSLSDPHGDETAPPPRWLTLHVEARGPLRGSLSASTAVLVDVRHTAFALVLHGGGGGGGGDADGGTHPPPGATLTLALAASAALAALLLLVLVTAALVCCSRRRRRRRRQGGAAVGQDGPGAEKNLKSTGGGRDGGGGGPDEGMRLKPTRLDGEGGERCSDLPAIARDAEKFLPEEKILACRRGDGGGDSDSDTARDRARRPCVYSITAPYPDEEPPGYSPGTRGPREALAGSAPTHSPSSATAAAVTAAVTSCCCCRHGGSDTGGGGGCPDSRAGSGSGSCSCSGSGSASGRGSTETDFGVDAEIRMINEILRASGFSGKSGGPDSSGSCCCGAGTGVGGVSGVGGGGCCLAPTGCCVSDCCRCRGEADGDVDRPDASQQHRHHHHHHHHHGGGGGSGSNAGGHHHHGHHHHHHQQQQHACRRLPDSGILQDEDQLSDVSRTSRASRDGKSVTSVTVEATASDADTEPRTLSASTLTRTSLAATTAGGSHALGGEGSGPGLALATDGARRFSSYSSASTLADEAGGTAPLSPSSSSSSATAAAAAGSPPSTASSLRSAFTSAALTPVRKSSAFSEIGRQPHRTAAGVNDSVEDDAQQQQQQLHLQGGKLGQLLDFGPRFGAMASVFAEIGRLRDENDRSSEAPAAFAVGGAGGVGVARRAVAGMPSERISRDCAKILPPPLITSVAAASARSVPPARPLPYPYARTALLPMPPLVTPPALAGAADEDENSYGGGGSGGGPYPVATLLPSSVPSGAMSPLLSPSLSPLAPPTGAPGSAALAGVVPPYLLPCSAVTPLMIVTGGTGSGASGRGAVSTRGSLDDDDEDDGMEIRI
ncbi:protocadherin-16-like isoform X2 [Petromyzon marinus]|uniref:protocadherin-16-like isoform X2 n=1 Tax=Petromyzon marinus TaxID=7757 RepID=UPI003F7211D4